MLFCPVWLTIISHSGTDERKKNRKRKGYIKLYLPLIEVHIHVDDSHAILLWMSADLSPYNISMSEKKCNILPSLIFKLKGIQYENNGKVCYMYIPNGVNKSKYMYIYFILQGNEGYVAKIITHSMNYDPFNFYA